MASFRYQNYLTLQPTFLWRANSIRLRGASPKGPPKILPDSSSPREAGGGFLGSPWLLLCVTQDHFLIRTLLTMMLFLQYLMVPADGDCRCSSESQTVFPKVSSHWVLCFQDGPCGCSLSQLVFQNMKVLALIYPVVPHSPLRLVIHLDVTSCFLKKPNKDSVVFVPVA